MDMRTDLTAVPHAGLGYQFPRVPVRTIGSWGSARGSEAKNSRLSTAAVKLTCGSTSLDEAGERSRWWFIQREGVGGETIGLRRGASAKEGSEVESGPDRERAKKWSSTQGCSKSSRSRPEWLEGQRSPIHEAKAASRCDEKKPVPEKVGGTVAVKVTVM